jgi:hypothetical protein
LKRFLWIGEAMRHCSFALLVVLGCATPVCAGGAPHRAAYVPAYAGVHAPQFFYFVGQPVRIAALVEAELRSDPEYRLFLEYKEQQSEFAEFLKKDGSAKPASKESRGSVGLRDSAPVVVRRCASCHSGAAPEGGLFLDGRQELSASQITAAQRRVLAGEMPPAETLSAEEVGKVLQDLLTLERSKP